MCQGRQGTGSPVYGLESNPESSLQLHRRLDSLEATQWAPRDTYRVGAAAASTLAATLAPHWD